MSVPSMRTAGNGLDDAVEKGEHFGVIFIDPARRASDGSRVFALADCEPNIIEMLPKLKRVCELLIVKMSPMLDISHTVSELNPFSVIALGTPTECKGDSRYSRFQKSLKGNLLSRLSP